MNRYLLDTNAWFWFAIGDERLATDVVATLEVAVGDGRVFLSQISLWEIALKVSVGKIRLNRPVEQWLKENVSGVNLLDLPIDIVVESTQLPGQFHKDTADRFIVATARTHGLTLVTGDGPIIDYATAGHLRVLAV